MQPRIPQLDAVRGVAILLVMIHNSGALPRLFAHGWMGVDLFFVLSGFLITGILLDTKQSDGYFKNFYVRRCLRIWPLYYSALIFMFVLVPILRPSEAHAIFESRASPWWAYPLFIQNLLVTTPTMATGLLGTTWSLAVEEQFYLVWPWVIRYSSRVTLRRIIITVLCVSPALRLYLSLHNVDIYPNTFCRLDALMAGAFLALVVRSENFLPSSFMRRAWAVLFIAGPLALVAATFNARWIAFSFTAMASAAFVYLALFSAHKWLRIWLTNRFLVYTGTISYGLYLLHKIPFDIAKSFHFDEHSLLALPIAIVASYALATLSWNFLEKPFLRLKRFFESKSLPPNPAKQQFVLAPQEGN